MTVTQLFHPISDELAQIEQTILQQIQTDIPLLTHVAEHILSSGGKRLRPALLLLSAQVFNHQSIEAQQAAQAVEYLHTATLLHDDVVDGAEFRRTKQAARQIWGNSASVSAGDYLLSKAFQLLTQIRNIDILQVISSTTTLMAQGELLQLVRSSTNIQEQDYLKIIQHKTASLFAAATKMGSILGNASETVQEKLYDYGMSLGVAFQIVDDTLDYMGDVDSTGKQRGVDLQERKVTLPLSHLMQHAPEATQTRVSQILELPDITEEHIEEVIQMMQQHGTFEYSLGVAKHYVQQAKNSLQELPESPAQQSLMNLSDFVVARTQ